MKNILILTFTILLLSCKKDNNKTTSTTTVSNSSPQTTNNYENSLLGNWKLFNFSLTSGTTTVGYFFNDSVSCHLELKSELVLNTTQNYKKAFGGLSCNNQDLFWKSDNVGYFNLGGLSFVVKKLTSDSLIIETGSINVELHKYTFWK